MTKYLLNNKNHAFISVTINEIFAILLINKIYFRDFPGGPVVKNPCFHCKGCRFTLVMELRSSIPCSVTKKTQNFPIIIS